MAWGLARVKFLLYSGHEINKRESKLNTDHRPQYDYDPPDYTPDEMRSEPPFTFQRVRMHRTRKPENSRLIAAIAVAFVALVAAGFFALVLI